MSIHKFPKKPQKPPPVDEQVEELRELKKSITETPVEQPWFGLPKYQERLLRVVMLKDLVSTANCHTAMYFDKDIDHRAGYNAVGVQMAHVRNRLRHYLGEGNWIECQWGHGYYVTKENKLKIRIALADYLEKNPHGGLKKPIIKTQLRGFTEGSKLPSPYAIEKGIPIPTGRYDPKYPFGDLKVGESFFVPKPEGVLDSEHLMSSTGNLWRKWRNADKPNRKHMQFASRRVTGGIRVWRIEDKK